jgi:hypothetical protein
MYLSWNDSIIHRKNMYLNSMLILITLKVEENQSHRDMWTGREEILISNFLTNIQ